MGKGRSSLGQQIERKLTGTFENPLYGNKLLQAQGLDPFRLVDAAPMDDEVEPFAPTGLIVESYLSALSVEWSEPPRTDYVNKAIVEITPSDTGVPAQHTVTRGVGTTITDLSYVDHNIRIKFVDLWDRESEWSTTVTGKPNAGADYMIDLEAARLKGNLSGLIPTINTALLGGENFAENTVKAVALAQSQGANLLPMIEVDFDAWADQLAWPPLDTDAAGTRYILSAFGSGITAKVVARNGLKWLEQTRAAGATGTVMNPFPSWQRRGIIPGQEYILSAYVQGSTGQTARLVAEVAQDSAGLNGTTTLAFTNSIALNGNEAGQRIFCKIPASVTSSHPFMRVQIRNETPNTAASSIRWTRFQLEHSSGKNEPSPWSAGILGAGTINARMLTAIDANIANVLFKTASIDTAFIKSLTADKIVAGTISTGTINIASRLQVATGGDIKCGTNTTLSSSGLTLVEQANYNTTAMSRDSKISGVNDKSAIAFYSDTVNLWEGIILRTDGFSGTGARKGVIALHATLAGTLGSPTAGRLEIIADSVSGQVKMYNDAYVIRDMNVGRNLIADFSGSFAADVTSPTVYVGQSLVGKVLAQTNIPANSGQASWLHGFPGIPRLIFMQYLDGGRWRPIGEDWYSASAAYWKASADVNYVYLLNGSTISYAVRGMAFY